MNDAPTDTDGLGQHMVRQIEALGVDAAALLPPARVEELRACGAGGRSLRGPRHPAPARPAAIRRLSRRVLSERDLRDQSDRFVARYQALLTEAAGREGGLRAAMTLLASDAGRAFLLLDAAVGDL